MRRATGDGTAVQESPTLNPSKEELAVLGRMDRMAFRVAHRMNRGRMKLFWTACQRAMGARWIHLATYNLVRTYGIENLSSADPKRPVLLVANHRSFFDMYVVSTVLFRRTKLARKLFFPVRGRFFYETPFGMLVNLLMGWWSMYPPFFAVSEKRIFDRYSMRRLTQLCARGEGHIIGFHPEGTRNLDPDPYTYLRAQPGVGKIIKDAAPQVFPVFVAGLGNNLMRQVLDNWRGGEPVRVYFGHMLDLEPFLNKKDHSRTYKEIAEFVMSSIAEVGDTDRTLYK